jgi:hypothetical protein
LPEHLGQGDESLLETRQCINNNNGSIMFKSLLAAFAMTGALALVAAPVSAQCDNSCASANDTECDDGGPGSLYDICGLGTDCADCGTRICNNSCVSSNDNECDDGGPGSVYDICEFGSDCNDCGQR